MTKNKALLASLVSTSFLFSPAASHAANRTTTMDAFSNYDLTWAGFFAPSNNDNLIYDAGLNRSITLTQGAPAAAVRGSIFSIDNANGTLRGHSLIVGDKNAYTITSVTNTNKLDVKFGSSGSLQLQASGDMGGIDFNGNDGTFTAQNGTYHGQISGNISGNVANPGKGSLVIDGQVGYGTYGDPIAAEVQALKTIEITSGSFSIFSKNMKSDNGLEYLGHTAQVSFNDSIFQGNIDFNGQTGGSLGLGNSTIQGDVVNGVNEDGIVYILSGTNTITGDFGGKNSITIQIGAGHILNIGGSNIQIKRTEANLANLGTINFTKAGEVTFAGSIGTTNSISAFNFPNVTKLLLKDGSIKTSTILGGNNSILATTLNTNVAISANNVSKAQTTVAENSRLTLTVDKYESSINSGRNDGDGTVIFESRTVMGAPIGTTRKLSTILLKNGLVAGGDISANTLDLRGGGECDLNGFSLNASVIFRDLDPILRFSGSNKFTGTIASDLDGLGKIDFRSGDTYSAGARDKRLALIMMGADGNVSVRGNLYAKQYKLKNKVSTLTAGATLSATDSRSDMIVESGATLKLTEDHKFYGGAGLSDGAILDLGENTLAIYGKGFSNMISLRAGYVEIVPQLQVNPQQIQVNPQQQQQQQQQQVNPASILTIKTKITENKAGNIESDNSEVQNANLVFEVDNQRDNLVPEEKIRIIQNVDGRPLSYTINFAEASKRTHNFAYEDGYLVVSDHHGVTNNFKNSVKNVVGANADLLLANSIHQSGDAAEFVRFISAQSPDVAASAIGSLTNTHLLQVIEEAVQDVLFIIKTSSNQPTDNSDGASNRNFAQNENVSGVSAGDETKNYGIWVQGFGGNVRQKKYKDSPGYKAANIGGVVGADTLVNDYTRLGLAFSHTDSTIKMRDEKSGDKSLIKSYMLSLYGTYELSNSLYLQGLLAYNISNIASKERRVLGANISTSQSKYSNNCYIADIGLGYKKQIKDSLYITPEIGLRASGFIDSSYTETGNRFNKSVIKKSGTSYIGNFAATIANSFDFEGSAISPAFYVGIEHEFAGKKPEIISKLNGQFLPFISKSKPANKTYYSTGIEATIISGMMEYEVGYEISFAKKYIANTGTFKIRVNL